jgi:glycosyltransferase involved in cell wall biosynthesis
MPEPAEAPLVSVAMPIYNHELYVEEALISALEQNYDRLEVVASDDASTDRTQDIMRSLHTKYPGRLIPIYGDRNVRATKNTNRALSQCRGEFVAVYSGDDVMLPGKIAAQVALMRADASCALSYHDVEMFAGDRIIAPFSAYQTPREGGSTVMLDYGMFFCACSAMVRVASGLDVRFNEQLPHVSDWLYFLDVVETLGGTVRRLPGIWGRYRIHEASLTRSMSLSAALEEQLRAVEIVEAQYPQLGRRCVDRRAALLAIHSLSLLKRERHLRAAARTLLTATQVSPRGALLGGARALASALRRVMRPS